MGGKDKKGQRTKGNVKPSSSGRSAELLGNITGFVGFTGLPEGAYVPVLGTSMLSEETDFSIPGEFRLTLRKMGKKDSTTKMKALGEFIELCSQSQLEALKTVLPFWPRIFMKLAIDNDRRVRENAHKAHQQIASKMGRNLAPHLKELMGCWFTSQCDTFTPAATVASQSLRSCFPENKLPEAVLFCHTEIMEYISNCLFKSEDVMEEQKERVLVGALSGYALLLQQVQRKDLEQEGRYDKHRQLWAEPNLYKVVTKNESTSIVKQSWFHALQTLSQVFPELIQENSSKILPNLSSFLDDSDSLTQSAMWQSALTLFVTVTDLTAHLNLSASLTPRLLNLLRNACYGNASALGPLILPLTRVLRENLKPHQKETLDSQLMASVRQGFSEKSVTSSTTEAAAFSRVYAQTLDFSARNSPGTVGGIFSTQVKPLLESLIHNKRGDLVLGHVIHSLTVLLYQWYVDSESVAEEFWSALEEFIGGAVSQTPHSDPSAIRHISLILSILLDPTYRAERDKRQPVARPARIRFNEAGARPSSSVPLPVSIPSKLSDKLYSLCVSLCGKALECSEQNQSQPYLELLADLLRHEPVARQFLAAQDLNPREMISRFIQPMLDQRHDGTSASLLFTLLNVVESEERSALLEKVIHDQATCLALATTALDKFHQKETVLEWLHGPQIRSLLESIARQLCHFELEDPTAGWNLIRAALNARRSSDRHDLVLPESHIDVVLSTFADNLTAANSTNNIQDLTGPFCNLWQTAALPVYSLETTTKFLDNICQALCSNAELPTESVNDLISIWNTGAAFNARPRAAAAVVIVKRLLMANPNPKLIDRFLLLWAQIDQLVDHDSGVLASLVAQLLPSSGEWKSLSHEGTSVHMVAKELLIASLYLPDFTGQFRAIQLDHWSALLKVAFVVSDVIAGCAKEIGGWKEWIPQLFYAAASAQLLLHLYNRRPQELETKGIQSLADRLNTNLDAIVSRLTPLEQTDVYRIAVSRSEEAQGWIWNSVVRRLQSICDFAADEADKFVPTLGRNDGKRNMIARQLMEQLNSQPQEWRSSRRLLTSVRLVLTSLGTEADSETVESVVALVHQLQRWQLENSEEFLFGTDLKDLNPSTAALTVIEIIRVLAVVVEFHPKHLPSQLWDFIMCSMTSWCSTLDESWNEWGPSHLQNSVLLGFTVALCRLVQNCSRLVLDIQQKRIDESGLPPNLTSEWDDVFSEAAFSAIVPLFLRLSQRWNKIHNPVLDSVMEFLVSSAIYVPKQHLQQPMDVLCPLLMSKHPSIQLGAYGLVVKLLPDVAVAENGRICSEGSVDQDKSELPPPRPLNDLLQQTAPEGLEDVRVGDLHLVEPYSQECTRLMAHLLTWKLVLNLCGCSSSELRYQYAAHLGNTGLISQLMDDLFRIIPHACYQRSIDLDQELRPQEPVTTTTLQDLAIQVYASALRHLPAVIRRWWNNADKRTALLVEKFTTKCVSPALCTSDLQHVSSTWDNMTVKVRLSAREAIATYKLNEEASMELVVQLPPNYPLGNITVEGGRKVGVTTGQWRTWMLQLTTFLMHQNGSILDGLTLWKRNVDKRFEGIEECYICYYVLHGSNYQLPKLTCRTCKKKFHAACLYKWFSTSNNSTCPLCRNLF